MIIYVLIWSLIAVPTVTEVRLRPDARFMIFALLGSFLTLFIGLRFEVGGDWYNYIALFDLTAGRTFVQSLAVTDPAYAALSWLSFELGTGIYLVNFVCAAVFTLGLMAFCLRQPLPGIALAVATPYLLFVVAMGYTRQAAALGFVFWALTALESRRTAAFVLRVITAAMFHKSALVLLPLVLIAASGTRAWRLLLLFVMLVPIAVILTIDTIMGSWSLYVDSKQLSSDGGAIRVWMNVVPAILFLVFRARWASWWPNGMRLWTWLSYAALACVPLQGLASTAIDRLALYAAPLQLVVYSRLPMLLSGPRRGAFVVAVMLLYATVLLVWLTYSPFAACCWIPYRFVGMGNG